MNIEVVSPEEARADALPEISTLLAAEFPRPRPWLDELRWMYLDNPCGRAWWVNARGADGQLVGHSAFLALPHIDDVRFERHPVRYSLHTAVRRGTPQPGLMVLMLRTLIRDLGAAEPSLLLGAANARSYTGLVRLLKFRELGRLSVGFFPPGWIPRPGAERALRLSAEFLRWRAERPGAISFVPRGSRALLRRILHRGIPIDGVLTVDAPAEWLAPLALPGAPRGQWPLAPRLYATFGPRSDSGVPVPGFLRPSPLHYMCRSIVDGVSNEDLAQTLTRRRFEFIDFDVM